MSSSKSTLENPCPPAAKRILGYTRLGVIFIWISAIFVYAGAECAGICRFVPFAVAALVSAITMWIIAGNIRAIYRG